MDFSPFHDKIRTYFSDYLSFLGVSIDEELNNINGSSSSGKISSPESRIGLYVVKTDEELMIAKQVSRLFSEDGNTSL